MKKSTFSLFDAGKLIASIALCQAAGGIGAIFTTSQINNWYQYLEKPPLNPPNWVFGPVWTLLYAMMGTALFVVYKYGKSKKKKKRAIEWFLAQLILNTLWSIIFFGLNSPGFAAIVIIALWTLIFITMKKFFVISKWAGWLMIPYLAWVSFASYLNIAIWWLN